MPAGLKPKDLIGQPWRLAFALQDDGWYLRSDCIWAKPNPMPESVTDRPTKSHEYVFLLTKSARYFYDADAVRETVTGGAHARGDGVNPKAAAIEPGDHHNRPKQNASFSAAVAGLVSSRNMRTVWTIATQPYAAAHFATFPETLPDRCIRAGTSERGCCAECGAPWERVVDESARNGRPVRCTDSIKESGSQPMPGGPKSSGQAWQDWSDANPRVHVGWRPTCTHDAPTVPCVVLDPFAGSGTVGVVAHRNGCHSILIEGNPEYVELIRRRTAECAQRGLFTSA